MPFKRSIALPPTTTPTASCLVCWKIDYYDETLRYSSEDPADPALTMPSVTGLNIASALVSMVVATSMSAQTLRLGNIICWPHCAEIRITLPFVAEPAD